MDSATLESAREFLTRRKIRSYAELTPAQRPTAEPRDDSICQPLVQTAFRLDARWPRASLAQIAGIMYGSRKHEKFNLGEAFTVDIDGVWRLMVIPYESESAPTAGVEPGRDTASGFAYSYVACHGTNFEAARGIATDGFARPSAWSVGVSRERMGVFPLQALTVKQPWKLDQMDNKDHSSQSPENTKRTTRRAGGDGNAEQVSTLETSSSLRR